MNSRNRFRRFPPVCLLVAVILALLGRLRFRRRYIGTELVMEDGQSLRVFRHLSRRGGRDIAPAVLVVRFRFARFSQGLNRLLSLVPVPLIGGFPGFRAKLWMLERDSGYWQGVYEWGSAEDAEAYCRSFVLRVMNRRADPESVSCTMIPQTRLTDYLERRQARTPG